MPETKEWTLMFYFASDNPLASTIVSQLKAIKNAGFHPDANVIAQFDPFTRGTPIHLFDVNNVNKLEANGKSQVGFGANDPYVRSLVVDKLWVEDDIREGIQGFLNGTPGRDRRPKNIVYNPPKPSRKMSEEQSPKDALLSFLDFCRAYYPARHYMLFMLGHGLVVGHDMFLYDEDAPQHSLSLKDLGDVLGKFKLDIEQEDERGQLDLIGFHSCSMSALEVAFELKGVANYMLASQGPAFVGSWPYRNILIRVFNDLNSSEFKSSDFNLKEAAGLIGKLKRRADVFSHYLRGRFSQKTNDLLDRNDGSRPPEAALVNALVGELNRFLEDPALSQAEWVSRLPLSRETRERLKQKPRGAALKWLNRMMLADVYPEVTKKDAPCLKQMLTKIFYYCLYNSYDYQLAGYSFDLCLCDLSKVRDITVPFNNLTSKLIQSLREKGTDQRLPEEEKTDPEEEKTDPLMQQLILLAHWDAQSFWQESYTDLYDFCFCLYRRCRDAKPGSVKTKSILKDIKTECVEVMKVLGRGSEGADDRLIVRSAFAGPAYQYSHGLSIYFPWAEPLGSRLWNEEYEQHKLIQKIPWKRFLETYFECTQRHTYAEEYAEEPDPMKPPLHTPNLDEGLLEKITTLIFNTAGQLTKSGPHDRTGKSGPHDPTGKNGPNDPTGADCECPSIKNYPTVTGARRKTRVAEFTDAHSKKREEDGGVPVSPNFFEGFNQMFRAG